MDKLIIRLHQKQLDFRRSTARVRAYTGGIGSGKSFVGAYDLLARALPGRMYGIYAPTYPQLRDSTLESFKSVGYNIGNLISVNESTCTARLGNGARVICRSCERPENLRGPNLSGAWIDEASLIDESARNIIIGRLREDPVFNWETATFTPKGRMHWTYATYATDAKQDKELFVSSSKSNPFLPPGFVDHLRTQYTTAMQLQELDGEFVDGAGAVFHREWFRIVDDYPRQGSKVRFWDLAATEAKTASDDPDYMAGVLMTRHNGQYWILDVRRKRQTPLGVENIVKAAANEDGYGVAIRMEEEGGSSGKSLVQHYARNVLPGKDLRGIKADRSKYTRAQPFAAAAENGNVFVLRAPWNRDLLDELEGFPNGKHDDQVDACSGAFNEFGKGRSMVL